MKRKTIAAFLKKNTTVILFGIIGAVIVDSFALPFRSDLIFFAVTGAYGAFAMLTGIGSRLTFSVVLGLIGLLFVSFVAGQASNTTEKLAVWFFLFLSMGIIQGWRE